MIWLLGVTILMMFKGNCVSTDYSSIILVFTSCSSRGPSVTSRLPFSVSSLALQVCAVYTGNNIITIQVIVSFVKIYHL